MFLYIDIETIPAQDPVIKQVIADGVTHPGNISKPESIEKWNKEKKPAAVDEIWRKTSLSGTYGEIACISWAIDDEDPKVVYRGLGESEKVLLGEFFRQLYADLVPGDGRSRRPVWVGHYITGFDLRFIWQRCVINGVKPLFDLPFNAKPWGEEVYDTKTEWTGLKSTGGGKLDDLCKAMGYEGKGDIDGSKVWDYVRDGKIEEVADYCKDDVIKTRLVHKRLTFQ